MTVTWRTATGLEADGTLNVAWTLPTGHTTDDFLAAVVGQKFSTAGSSSAVPTPTGYTAVTSGCTDNTNRAVMVQAFHKVDGGSESAPTETASGAICVMWGMMAGSSSESGSGWSVESSTGIYSTQSGTDVTVTGDTSLAWAVGDEVLMTVISPNELATDSSPALTIAGSVTHSGLTQHLSPVSTTQGSDGTLYVYTATITGGGTGAPTYTATSDESGMTARAVAWLKIIEPESSSTPATATPTAVAATASVGGDYAERNASVVMGGASKQGVWA